MATASRRRRVNKKTSAKSFNRQASKTQKRNVAGKPMRGGIRA